MLSKKQEIKAALKDELEKQLPLMDVENVRERFLNWAREIPFPTGGDKKSWEECLHVYPPTDEEHALEEGRRIRFALKLTTGNNQYVIVIMESLVPANREIYSISLHVGWSEFERTRQKSLDDHYKGHFEDVPRARHTIWAQTLRINELETALDACLRALVGHELIGAPSDEDEGTVLKQWPLVMPTFPELSDD